jgi:hypothetical protein
LCLCPSSRCVTAQVIHLRTVLCHRLYNPHIQFFLWKILIYLFFCNFANGALDANVRSFYNIWWYKQYICT